MKSGEEVCETAAVSVKSRQEFESEPIPAQEIAGLSHLWALINTE